LVIAGRKVLAEVATVAQPDTILAWYRKLVARKFDGSKARQGPGRPRVRRVVEELIVAWRARIGLGLPDRIAGACNLGYVISMQTVGMFCECLRPAAGTEPQRNDPMQSSFNSLGALGGNRLLHRRGADTARAGDLLRAVLYSSREPPR